MSGHMAHQFTCRGRSACVMVTRRLDRAYDIHWGKGG